MRSLALALALVPLAFLFACGEEPPHVHDEGPYVVEVVSFEPGEGAGFGQDAMPDVVMGPPVAPESTASGSLDVVSLGAGGVIVLRMGSPVTDEDGVDFIVFENPFIIGAEQGINSEAGEVSVSPDGVAFTTFACDPEAEAPNGCAGFGVVLDDQDPTNPATTGGDQFDLADVGIESASFVRIQDRGTTTAGPSAGFDLDAIASVH